MSLEKIIKRANEQDHESLDFELKQTGVCFDKMNNFTVTKILELIVGIANRKGGQIIIGIKDDGQPEGLGIFKKFESEMKSGVDKFKEKVVNECNDNISPIINIEMNHYQNDEYEVMQILIPKKRKIPHAIIRKRGDKVESRKYYIKTSHSNVLVSDTQLDWLFSEKNNDVEEAQFTVELTTSRDLKGMPISIGKFGDRFVMQPSATDYLFHYIRAFSDDTIERCQSDTGYKYELMTEALMYTIIQSLEGNVIGETAVRLPRPSKEFRLFQAIKGQEPHLFDSFDRKVNFPPKSKLKITKPEDQFNNIIFTITNDYVSIDLELLFYGWKIGVFSTNPYASILIENNGMEGQNYFEERYESYRFILKTKIERFFPDTITQEYYDSFLFANNINERIKQLWDINYFMKEYPHYKNLYSIEYKIDKNLNMLENKMNEILNLMNNGS
ncbi:AlbA family DNA-binding domain-containing protein [Clostridium aminobutyricum]|uniref:ATP-binding protein n=1 Tax=Clostridium aminobutyricum TaxID=33953 RepID=A0A939IIR9_CLOAM|nr:ATP-binding protein [Clostridium aminobutyricum]MBN7772843.1 ATP-binding protein [Clostridium aminobutyricum]